MCHIIVYGKAFLLVSIISSTFSDIKEDFFFLSSSSCFSSFYWRSIYKPFTITYNLLEKKGSGVVICFCALTYFSNTQLIKQLTIFSTFNKKWLSLIQRLKAKFSSWKKYWVLLKEKRDILVIFFTLKIYLGWDTL